MPPASDARARRLHLSRRWVLGWLGVFLGCAGLWGCHAILYDDQRERAARFDELTDLLDPYLRQPSALRGKLENDLNQGRSFDPIGAYVQYHHNNPSRYRWSPSDLGPRFAGWKVDFVFGPRGTDSTAQALVSYKLISPEAQADISLLAARAEMEATYNIVLLLGGGVWFLAMLTIFFALPWRRQVAQVSLAGVIIAAVAWSLGSNHNWQRPSLVAPLPIGIATAGLLSLLALIVPGRRSGGRTSIPRCTNCGYDLTGNQSGICPECGCPTLRKRLERWQEQAEQLRVLSDDAREVESTVAAASSRSEFQRQDAAAT